MESKSYAVALLILAVAGLGNCSAVNSELRKLSNRINKRINSMQQNINNLELNIADLEYENRELRKDLEGEKNRTSELEIKLKLSLSRSPAITDTESTDSTVQEELHKIEGVINRLTRDVEHFKSKSHQSTSQLQVTVRKAFKIEKALFRKLNKTLQHKQEEATKEVRTFIAKSNASLGRHVKNIENLYNTTSNNEEALLEITTKVDSIITSMANMSIRMSQNERSLTAVSDCGSHKEVPNGDVSGDSFVGGTPVVSCNTGYSQTGSAQCKVPVFWETDVKCQKDCAVLHVANGMVTPEAIVQHGTTVRVTCDSDYMIVGNNTAICNNGAFTDVPSCRRRRSLTDLVVASSSSYNVRLEDDSSIPGIFGAEFLSNGQLVLCDSWNRRMKLLSSDFSMLDSLQVQSWPPDVSAINSTTVLITLPDIRQLQYIHVVPELQPSSTIILDTECWGVDVVGDEIFTSCYIYSRSSRNQGEILVFNMAGTLKRRISDSPGLTYIFSAPRYLTVNPDTGYIYVSDWYTDKVTCLSSAGDIIFRYDDPELDYPRGIYVDHYGNSIVCGSSSHNIHVITASGKKHRILLTKSDGLWYPYSVAYRESDATLVIGSHDSDNLLVLKLEN